MEDQEIIMNGFDKAQVKALGRDIGYGNMMSLASECWAELLEDSGHSGGEFVPGPCRAETVSCSCEQPSKCVWCCGSAWLTKKVKEAKDSLEGQEIPKKPQHAITEYGNYDPDIFKQFLDSSRSFHLCHTQIRSWGLQRVQTALVTWVKIFEKLEASGR